MRLSRPRMGAQGAGLVLPAAAAAGLLSLIALQFSPAHALGALAAAVWLWGVCRRPEWASALILISVTLENALALMGAPYAAKYLLDEVPLAIIAFLGVYRARSTGDWRLRCPVTAPLACFAGLGVLSGLVNGIAPWHLAQGLRGPAQYALLYYAILWLRPPRKAVRAVLAAAAALGVAFSLAAIAQVSAGAAQQPGWARASVGTGNPNILGGYLCIICLVQLSLGLDRPAGHRRVPIALCSVLGLGMVATRSREAWASALAGAGALAVSRRSMAPAALALLVALCAVLEPGLRSRLMDAVRPSALAREWRWRKLPCTMQVIRQHPMLGSGPGSYGGAVARRTAAPLAVRAGLFQEEAIGHIDSGLLTLWAEHGALGLLSFLALLRALCLAAGNQSPGLGQAGRAVVVAVTVLSLVSPAFEEHTLAVWLWGVCAIAAAQRREEGEVLCTRFQS